MKNKKEMVKTKEKLLLTTLQKIGLFAQGIVSVLAMVIGVFSIFNDGKYLLYLEILVALDMFIMAYNNWRIYKRKNYTIIYIVAGAVIGIFAVLSLFGIN